MIGFCPYPGAIVNRIPAPGRNARHAQPALSVGLKGRDSAIRFAVVPQGFLGEAFRIPS